LLEKIFHLSERNTNIKTEVIAGIVTFLTMAYIIAVNPNILSATGMNKGALFTATCLATGITTILMGVFANYPYSLSVGMGLNAFFAFTVCGAMGYSYRIALTAVFIETMDNRDTELKCNEDFAHFLIQEIIPWVKEKYNISNNPKDNIIGGSSLGGLTASFIGLNHSNIFGNVLSQSGSYWYKWEESDDIEKCNWMARQYESAEKLNLKFYLNVGTLETQKMIDMNKGMRHTLVEKGYIVDYEEFKSGHDYLCWGETLADGLISLVGIQ
jgi:esterase/lipase superfamily enzyme